MKIKASRLIYLIVYIIIFIGATVFVANTYMYSGNIKEILFGSMLLLVFLSEILREVNRDVSKGTGEQDG